MSPSDAAKARHDMANSLLEMREQFAPIFDTAEGMRADMEKRGWSPTAAEAASLTWLQGALTFVWQSAEASS
jgi:hypothetical protein